jgi:competence protein ComEA
MLKKILALVAMLYAAVCFAAVDVNKGDAAALDSINGIGPAMSTKILDERKKGDFKDWNDFMTRVKGVREKKAAQFSQGGLTVNGAAFAGAPAAPAKADKKAAKAEEKKADDKPAAKDVKADAVKPAASAAKK